METAFVIAAVVTALSALALIVCFIVEVWSGLLSNKVYKIAMTSYVIAMVALVTAVVLAYAIW